VKFSKFPALKLPVCEPRLVAAAAFFLALSVFAAPACFADTAATDALKQLAEKVAAQIGPNQKVTPILRCSWGQTTRNETPPCELTAEQLVFDAGLQSAKVELVPLGQGMEIDVALTEDMSERLWVARFAKDGKSAVLIVPFVKAAAPEMMPAELWVQIQARRVYEQAEPILDFAVLSRNADAPAEILVLDRDKAAMYAQTSGHWAADRVAALPPLPAPKQESRAPVDSLSEDQPGVFRIDRGCHIRTATHSFTFDCPEPPGRGAVDMHVTNLTLWTSPQWGDDVGGPLALCGNPKTLIATGTGDYTQPDHLQVFALGDRATAVSERVDLPGPVMALSHDGAVVRNLKTGNYEAYEITFSCNH
jgi:hypothetical protein